MYLRGASRRISRAYILNPKCLHWLVAKFESNTFEMTFHLTKHKRERQPYTPYVFAPTRWLVPGFHRDNVSSLSFFSSVSSLPLDTVYRTISRDHPAASRNIILWVIVCQPSRPHER